MGRHSLTIIGLLALVIYLGACGQAAPQPAAGVALSLQSSAFADSETIPVRYTCDGDDVSPALSWAEPPAGTQALALVVDDPDAPVGTWVHWVLFNLPATVRSLPEGVFAGESLPEGGLQGANSWKQLEYGGPCPPQGSTHRYFFKLYALDTSLDLSAGATKGDVEKAMNGHVLAQGQLVGRYSR
jgi:Raf kinase inhibitor-like YbhB/YbcL family protein